MDELEKKVAEAIYIARNGERNRKHFSEQQEPYLKDAKAAISVMREHEGEMMRVMEEALQSCKLYDNGMAGRGQEYDEYLVEQALAKVNEMRGM